MKKTRIIKDELNREIHKNCLFHFVAENKKESCLVCVVKKAPVNYTKNNVIIIFGIPQTILFRTIVSIKDLYLLMFDLILMPKKMKVKYFITKEMNNSE